MSDIDYQGLDPSFVNQVKQFEGFQSSPYGDYHQTSIGYGTKAQPGDTSIDETTATNRLVNELKSAQNSVQSFAGNNLTPGQQNALTSLTFNAGPGWQQQGLGQQVLNGDWQGAAQTMQGYNHAGGQVNPGLTARRATEGSWITGQTPAASAGNTQTASAQGTPQTGLLGLPTSPRGIGQSLGLPQVIPQGLLGSTGSGTSQGSGTSSTLAGLLGGSSSGGNSIMNMGNQAATADNKMSQQDQQTSQAAAQQAMQAAMMQQKSPLLNIKKLV